jgi:hypothetical protein
MATEGADQRHDHVVAALLPHLVDPAPCEGRVSYPHRHDLNF